MKSKYIVKKIDGKEEFFDETKLKKSLRRSGATKQVIDKTITEVKKILFDGITTKQIFKKAFSVLKTEQHPVSLRYNLSAAVSEMGPSGFAFEKFIAEVFQAYGYSPVYTDKHIQGRCIKHEMDVIAFKGNQHITAELKFHNSRRAKSDLKVILYMKARFDDILSSGYYGTKEPRPMIITNTKFTTNAKKYAACSKLELLGWNFPYRDNLHDFILQSGIHPITALTTLSQKSKKYFLEKKIVSCVSLLNQNQKVLLSNPYIPKNKISLIIQEINSFCSFHPNNN